MPPQVQYTSTQVPQVLDQICAFITFLWPNNSSNRTLLFRTISFCKKLGSLYRVKGDELFQQCSTRQVVGAFFNCGAKLSHQLLKTLLLNLFVIYFRYIFIGRFHWCAWLFCGFLHPVTARGNTTVYVDSSIQYHLCDCYQRSFNIDVTYALLYRPLFGGIRNRACKTFNLNV